MVALRAEMKHILRKAAFDNAARDIAGTGDGVIGIVRHVQPVKNALHGEPGPRRIGNQNNRAAALAKFHQRLARLLERRNAVVHDTPDIAEQHVVVTRQRLKMRDDIGQDLKTSARRSARGA